jgi:hypothetical protein
MRARLVADVDIYTRRMYVETGTFGRWRRATVAIDDDAVTFFDAFLYTRAAVAYRVAYARSAGGLRKRKHADAGGNANQCQIPHGRSPK